MNLVILGVRWAHALEFFQIFTDQQQAKDLKRNILNQYPEDVGEEDVEITPIIADQTIEKSIRVYLEGKK